MQEGQALQLFQPKLPMRVSSPAEAMRQTPLLVFFLLLTGFTQKDGVTWVESGEALPKGRYAEIRVKGGDGYCKEYRSMFRGNSLKEVTGAVMSLPGDTDVDCIVLEDTTIGSRSVIVEIR